MQEQEILDWLRQHPDFFDLYAHEISDIYMAHSHGGKAISLTERQLQNLREKNRMLEAKLSELLHFGVENDQISDKLHRLTVDLLQTSDLPGVIGTLEYHLKQRFNVPHVTLRLWHGELESNLRELDGVSEAVHTLANNLLSPYCGPYVTEEVRAWFDPEQQDALQSFAQFALRTSGSPFGILVMASGDAERFYPDMGTLYLQRLSELVSAAIVRLAPPAAPTETEDAPADECSADV